MSPSIHVSVEGLDGAGKSTVLARAASLLSSLDVVAVTTHLPDLEASAGDLIARVLSHNIEAPPAPQLALAFALNRAAHYTEKLEPELSKATRPTVVLSHRHLLSGLAYQSMQGLSLQWLAEINRYTPFPDLSVFLDTSPEVCAGRLEQRAGAPEYFEARLETARHHFYESIDFLRERGAAVEVVDGHQSIDTLGGAVVDFALAALQTR